MATECDLSAKTKKSLKLFDTDDSAEKNGVRSIRQDKEITQESLAELLDKSVEHVSFIERERSLLQSSERRFPPLRLCAPSFELILKLAEALDVSVPHLLNIDQSQEDADL